MYTMGDIARCSIGNAGDYHNEELLYKLFGVNAEILIDHAWGWEPCTIADAKAYKPENKSIVSGQVLQCPYDFQKARLVAREMADALALDLVDKICKTGRKKAVGEIFAAFVSRFSDSDARLPFAICRKKTAEIQSRQRKDLQETHVFDRMNMLAAKGV